MALDPQMQAVVAGCVLLLALVVPLFFLFRMSKAPPVDTEERKPQPKVRKDKVDKEGGKKKGKRGAMDRMRAAKDRREEDEDEATGAGTVEGDDGDVDPSDLTKDELKRAEKRAEKAQAAREREEMREAMREREEAKLESRKQKEEEREAKWKAKEEAAALKKAEEEKKQQEEFEKWKDLITVDDEGTGEAEMGVEDQGLLGNFVNYIKNHKVVVLEDLAAQFELRVQDVIGRVQALESMGHITGVVDDRGKFIYVSTEEMDAVARFITKRGRISIAALAAESNKLIDLNSKAVEPVDTGDDCDDGIDAVPAGAGADADASASASI